VSLISLGNKPSTPSDSAIPEHRAEDERMDHIHARLLNNPFADSDFVRIQLLGIQNHLIYHAVRRIEAAINTTSTVKEKG
jgi:hypothetical protein